MGDVRVRVAMVWAVVAAAIVAAAPASAPASSLPQVTSGARPGPDLLYAPAPRAPQLENTGPWKAEPILVSGAEAYRGGEFLYQDFLFDDHGAAGSADDPNDPFNQVENMFAPKRGTLSYPTDAATSVFSVTRNAVAPAIGFSRSSTRSAAL